MEDVLKMHPAYQVYNLIFPTQDGHPDVPGSSGRWAAGGAEATGCECADCKVLINGAQFINDIFQEIPNKKTYFFYYITDDDIEMTYSAGAGASSTGPSVNLGASKKVTKGSAVVRMLRKNNERHQCIECFAKKHNTLWESVSGSLYGKCYFVNPHCELVNPKVGTGPKP